MSQYRLFRKMDNILLLAAAAVILYGLIVIGSATVSFSDKTYSQLAGMNFFSSLLHLDYSYVARQLIWVVLGIIVMTAMMLVSYQGICKYSRALYIFNLLMLGSVLVFGHSALGGQRWIKIGMLTIQPSEFSKLFMIIAFADFLAKRKGQLNRLRDLLPCLLYMGAPALLVLKQPDMGTSLVLIAIMFGMLYFAGTKPGLLLGVLGTGMALVIGLFIIYTSLDNINSSLEKELVNLEQQKKTAVTADASRQVDDRYAQVLSKYQTWHHRQALFYKYTLKEYQVKRLTIFLDPQSDLQGDGYNIWQSLIAIGSGGLTGKGFLQGTQSHLTFLPVRSTDFIFSVAGEEFGFLGAVVLLTLFLIIFYRGVKIASESGDSLGLLIATGVVSMFVFHVFVNVGMSSGIMPITGIPMPLFSYGGSNMIMNLAALGLVINVKLRGRQLTFD